MPSCNAFAISFMAEAKLALYALALELAAWSGIMLFENNSDGLLITYLVLHAAASFFLACLAILLLPATFTRPRQPVLLLMAACSFAVPILGFLGILAGVVFLRTYRQRLAAPDFASLQLPEFDPHQHTTGGFRQSGLRSFLGNTKAPTASRMGALVALQYVSGRVASPVLRNVLTDPSDDLRLLAYGMLDSQEKRINQAIDKELKRFADATSVPGADQLGEQALAAARRLSDLYWELIYQELVQGDLRSHALAESARYCQMVLQQEPGDAALILRQGRLLHDLGNPQGAATAYAGAMALGVPATRVLPYLAELHFDQGDYREVGRLMGELQSWSSLPRLQPVIEYWNPR